MKKSLFAIILLFFGIGQVWGYWIVRPKVYFYNSDGWTPGILLLGTNTASQGFNFVEVDNTKLWYVHPDIDWSGLTEANFGIGGNGLADWDYRDYEKFSDRWSYLTSNYDEHTSSYYNLQWDNNVYKFIKYINGVWTINSGDGAVPTNIAYLRVRYDERDGEGYGSKIEGSTTWSHGVAFDFTGTCWEGTDGKTKQTTVSLTQNSWEDNGNTKWGYENIPYSGEVTFVLTDIDAGFELEGWSFNEDDDAPTYTTNPTDVTFNITTETMCIAMIRRKQYTITLNDDGGSDGSGSKTLTYDRSTNMTTSVAVPTRTGYTFEGYYTEADGAGSMIIDEDGVWQKDVTDYTGTDSSGDAKWIYDESIELYAKWTPITYSISYELDGGTKFFADPTEYNIESATITLHAGAKSGYVFAGWYDNAGFTGDIVTSIPTGSTGDKTFYAKWTTQGCLGEHVAGTVFNMLMNVGPSDAVNLTAGNYVDLNSTHATFTRGTGVYGTTSSNAQISAAASDKARRTLQMTSTSHVVTLNLSCPLVAYDTIIIYDTHGSTAGKTYEFSITSSPSYSNTNSTSGATVSKSPDTTRYVVPVGSGLIGNTPIYVWGSASTDLRIRRIEIRRTNTWQLTYNANGGSGAPAAEYRPASAVALSSTVPTFGNYTFAGWNTATNGSSDNYDSGADYTIPSKTTTLYAKWTLDVTLNDNGGTGGSTSVTMTHKNKTHTDITLPTREGYTFTGYYNNTTGGIRVMDENGALRASAGSYTSSDSTWKYSAAGLTLYAQWAPDLTFNGDQTDHETEWNYEANWSPASLPTIYSKVTIEAPVTVNIANAKAKNIIIYNDGDTKTGKLTIASGKALAVATTIQKTTDGENFTATTAADIVLESDGTNGTGALVVGTENHNTAATVQFFTKAKKDGSGHYVNQYFGVPVDSVVKNPTYYGAYLRKFDVYNDAWASFSDSKMYGFTAYRIMRAETTDETYSIQGKLILPGTSTHKDTVLTLTNTEHKDNMFANSWTAPIDVTKFDAEDFVGAVATIYVFNAGSYFDGTNTEAYKDAGAGNWNAMPVEAVKAAVKEDPAQTTYDLTQIPSQQAFLVQTDGYEGTYTLKLDYKKLVYDPIVANGATIIPTRAPKRTETASELEQIHLYMTGESGLGDRVLMYSREDFSNDSLDNGWEAYKLAGSEFAPQICAYSPLGEMAIVATDDIEGTVLGYYAGTADDQFTFTFHYEGDQTWYLNDMQEQRSTLISNDTTYPFTAAKGSVAEHRFIISGTPIAQTPTDVDEVKGVNEARKILIHNHIYIILSGRMYNVDGALVK